MIAMQMTDEDMIDSVKIYVEFHQLHLGTFATINQKMTILNFH